VRVGVVDVGANTLRLLVADGSGGSVERVREERWQVGLGDEIEARGLVSQAKLAEAAASARRAARIARREGCDRIDVLVTSPGRQSANADELVAVLAEAVGLAPRVLSPEAEARLAWLGAVATAEVGAAGTVAVCDVGGGSAQVAVGTLETGPAWTRSFETGSLRLTRRHLEDDPPGAAAVARASSEVEEIVGCPALPLPQGALATGGTARALRRVVAGSALNGAVLESALGEVARRPRDELARAYGLDPARARTLLAGTLILAALQRRLVVPLRVADGGIREGAASLLLAEPAAASA
jgi:exopolyphosphatase / guanosine-5'-triphosphate,3'-diphosphate pyrophosphatase